MRNLILFILSTLVLLMHLLSVLAQNSFSFSLDVNSAPVNQDVTPDFNGDGTVDFPDFLMFLEKFGAKQGDGKYEARFDLDGDGTIAFPDFLIFVDNFGNRPPDRTFNIDLIFVRPNAFTPHEKRILSRAVGRWEEIITEDVPEVDYSKNPIDEWDEELQGWVVVDDRVDDLRIFVNEGPIVNAGGKGGPRHMCYLLSFWYPRYWWGLSRQNCLHIRLGNLSSGFARNRTRFGDRNTLAK